MSRGQCARSAHPASALDGHGEAVTTFAALLRNPDARPKAQQPRLESRASASRSLASLGMTELELGMTSGRRGDHAGVMMSEQVWNCRRPS